MKTIAVVAQKGGVAKTTTVSAIGAGLARYYSAKVLFVDTDAQGNLSRSMEADYSGTTGADVLEVLTGRVKATEAIQQTPHGAIIASTPALSGAEGREPTLTKAGRETRLKKALEAVSGAFDYCIIDTPPALSIITVNALVAADKVIIPAQADDYSFESISRLRETIEAVKTPQGRREAANPSLQVDGILLTRYNGRAVISREIADMMEAEAEALNTRIYSTRIRENIAVKEAQAMREDIFTYSPRSNAAKDYKAALDEMIGGADNG